MTLLELAARYLRTLHAIEQAHALGHEDEVASLLAAVDPVDVRQVAEEIECQTGQAFFVLTESLRA